MNERSIEWEAARLWADSITGEMPRKVPVKLKPADGPRTLLHAKIELRVYAELLRRIGPPMPLRPLIQARGLDLLPAHSPRAAPPTARA